MSQFLGFARKEIRHILRDRRTLGILLALPLSMVLLFGFAVRTDVREIRVVVVDPAPGSASRSLQNRLMGTPEFTVVRILSGSGSLESLFQRGEADQAIVLPTDLGTARGPDPIVVQVITDAADPNTGSTMQAFAVQVLHRWARDQMGAAAERGGVRIIPSVQMRFNPTLESVNLFVPGLIAVVLTVVSALMSAISLSREKELGTMEVLLVSPLRPWQIVLGKVVPYLLLGLLNVATVLLAAWLVFGVPFRGSLSLLVAESLLFVVASLALGVLIAAVTASQRTAMIGALMGLMLPTLLLSGMIFPIASMPDWLQVLSHLVPGRWFLVSARGIMLAGVGLEHVWKETLILTGITAAALVLAARSFNVRLSGSG